MQRARACDAANLLPCARRYAKAAMAIDTSYSDSRAFFRHVAYKQAAAKKAAALALAQAQAAAAPHPAPIRDATPFVHYVSHGNPVRLQSWLQHPWRHRCRNKLGSDDRATQLRNRVAAANARRVTRHP